MASTEALSIFKDAISSRAELSVSCCCTFEMEGLSGIARHGMDGPESDKNTTLFDESYITDYEGCYSMDLDPYFDIHTTNGLHVINYTNRTTDNRCHPYAHVITQTHYDDRVHSLQCPLESLEDSLLLNDLNVEEARYQLTTWRKRLDADIDRICLSPYYILEQTKDEIDQILGRWKSKTMSGLRCQLLNDADDTSMGQDANRSQQLDSFYQMMLEQLHNELNVVVAQLSER